MSWEATEYVRKLAVAPDGQAITRDEKILLLVLANCHNSHARSAWPAVTTLASECLASVRQVQRLLRSLERKAVLCAVRPQRQGRGAFTHYVFLELEKEGCLSVTLPPEKGDKRATTRARGEGFDFGVGSKSNPEPSPTLPFPDATQSASAPGWTESELIAHVAAYYLTRGTVVPDELRHLIPAALDYARAHKMRLVSVAEGRTRTEAAQRRASEQRARA